MENKRLQYFDTAKGLGILGVVVLHSGAIQPGIVIWLGSFIMPFFFIISGMLLSYKKEEEQKMSAIFLKKMRSVMMPYFGFSILYILITIFRSAFGQVPAKDISKDILYTFTLYGKSTLWFLPVLFLSETAFLFLRKRTSTVFTMLVSLLAIPASLYFRMFILQVQMAAFASPSIFPAILVLCAAVLIRTLFVIPYFCISYYMFHFFRDFWETKKPVSIPQILTGVVLILSCIPFSRFNGPVDIPMLNFGFVPCTYLTAVATSTGFLLLCKNCRPVRMITYFGNHSLIIMATHIDFFILYAATWIAGQIGFFQLFFIVLFTFLLEIPCIAAINRYLPFLSGKKHKPSPSL